MLQKLNRPGKRTTRYVLFGAAGDAVGIETDGGGVEVERKKRAGSKLEKRDVPPTDRALKLHNRSGISGSYIAQIIPTLVN